VVFRYRPSGPRIDGDRLNGALRQRLLERGLAVIGHTRVDGRQYLKLTCMNPATSEQEIEALLLSIVEEGKRLDAA